MRPGNPGLCRRPIHLSTASRARTCTTCIGLLMAQNKRHNVQLWTIDNSVDVDLLLLQTLSQRYDSALLVSVYAPQSVVNTHNQPDDRTFRFKKDFNKVMRDRAQRVIEVCNEHNLTPIPVTEIRRLIVDVGSKFLFCNNYKVRTIFNSTLCWILHLFCLS